MPAAGSSSNRSLRVRRRRTRDLEPPTVGVGEAVRGLIPAIAHEPVAEEREPLLGELADLAFLAPHPGSAQHRAEDPGLRVAVRRGHHVLAHGHVQEQPQSLERPRDAALRDAVRAEPLDRLALEQDVAVGGLVDARDEVEERRLPGAVRPDGADDLALVDVQVEVVDALAGRRTPSRRPAARAVAAIRRSPRAARRGCPDGRVTITPTSSAPRRTKRVTSGCNDMTFSHTNAAR